MQGIVMHLLLKTKYWFSFPGDGKMTDIYVQQFTFEYGLLSID
jgi:hypothetical protein